MMNRSRLVFLIVVGGALALVLAGVVLDQLDNQSDSQQTDTDQHDTGPIEITVAVSPLVRDWVEGAAQAYNGQRRRVDGRVVEIALETQDSLPVWMAAGTWTGQDHPVAWIPEITAAVAYANEVGLNFTILHESLASTVMVWGAPTDRAQVIQTQYGPLSWDSVQQASETGSWSEIGGQTGWGMFFKPGLAQPDRYTSGMAALLIAAAEHHDQALLDALALSDSSLFDWLKPVFESMPNVASLGAHPAREIATRGTSVADVALLPESEWLVNYNGLVSKVGPLTFVYPDYQFWFNFPLALWDGAEVSEREQDAVQDFLSFLLNGDQQRRAASFGLRQPDGLPSVKNVFERAMGAGIFVSKPSGETVQLPPARNDLTPFVNRSAF